MRSVSLSPKRSPRDGEGATKLIEVTVTSARDAQQAKRIAKAIVNSPSGQDRSARRRSQLGPSGYGDWQMP